MLPLAKTHFVDGDDIGMLQSGGGHRLGAEAFYRFRRRVESEEEELERDQPVQALLAGPIDYPHAAVPDLLEQLIIPEGAETWAARPFCKLRPGGFVEARTVKATRTKSLRRVRGNFRAAARTCAVV